LHKVHVHGAANSLLVNTKYVSDIVKLNLFESYMFSILTYAIDSVDLSKKQIREQCLTYF